MRGWRRTQASGFRYPVPRERIHMNPAPRADAFGLPAEAHLVPVFPKSRPKGPRIANPAGVAEYLSGLADAPVERMLVLPLNSKNEILGVIIVSQGTINETVSAAREVFAPAIAARAAAIILAHNHPSGYSTPSDADMVTTVRLGVMGRLLGIPVLDHIVIGERGKYTSLAAQGLADRVNQAASALDHVMGSA